MTSFSDAHLAKVGHTVGETGDAVRRGNDPIFFEIKLILGTASAAIPIISTVPKILSIANSVSRGEGFVETGTPGVFEYVGTGAGTDDIEVSVSAQTEFTADKSNEEVDISFIRDRGGDSLAHKLANRTTGTAGLDILELIFPEYVINMQIGDTFRFEADWTGTGGPLNITPASSLTTVKEFAKRV